MNPNLTIDIENSAGQKQGSGPITSASGWRYTARVSAAGTFGFTMPASDPKAILIQKKRVVRAYANLNGQRVEVGAGIIDTIEKRVTGDGEVMLEVGGQDLIRELNYRTVLNLKLYLGGNPVTHAQAVAALAPYAPPGWTLTPDGSPPNDSVYGYFNGESVLAGVVKIAEKSQNQFYRGTGRTLIFASTFTPSGVRAINAHGDLAANTCAITSLTEQVDVSDLITRIYPRGSGNAEVQLTLRASDRTMPSGFVMDTAENYIENSPATAIYGRIEKQVDFRDIGPIENTAADIRSAANMLADSALETLKRLSTEIEQAVYTVALAGCDTLLRPMQSMVVDYRDPETVTAIKATLNILEATWSVGTDGIYTTNVKVSNSDRWPDDDRSTLISTIADGKLYQALPQLSANSYVTAYNKNVDKDHTALFRFRLGNEITQLQQVFFEFQLLLFESTVKSVGGSSGGSGDIPTTGPSTNTSGAPSNDTSGGPSNNNSGGPNNNNTGFPSINSTGTPSTNVTGAPSVGQSGAASGDTGASFGNTASPSNNNSGAPSTNTSGGPSTNLTSASVGSTGASTGNTGGASGNTGDTDLVTDPPAGGDSDPSGYHQHTFNVIAGEGNHGPAHLHWNATLGLWFLSNPFVTGSAAIYVSPGGLHQHYITPHTHSIAGHSHSLNNHTHSLNNHTHDLGSHTHTLNNHTHSLNNHTHSLNDHTHSLNGHTHDLAGHTHTINHTHDLGNHTHDLGSHTHSLNNHTHSLNSHTHTLGNHIHSLATSITAVYGIFRDNPANLYGLAELQYRINGGAWASLSGAANVGGGWWRLDITALVTDAVTLRPNQESNFLEIGPSGSADKRATIDAQLSIRNTIQAIAYV